MEHDTYLEPTIFDTLTASREIQMLKSAIPYMNPSHKRPFAIFIKYMELQKAMQEFMPGTESLAACEVPAEENNRFHMLTEIRKYATPKEQELIDNLTSLFSMLSLYSDVS